MKLEKRYGNIMKTRPLTLIVVSLMIASSGVVLAANDSDILTANPNQGQGLHRGADAYAFCAYDPSYTIPTGIMTFNLDSPGDYESLSEWIPGQYGFCSGGTYDLDSKFYMADYDLGSSTLYSIDTETWVPTIIGPVGHSVNALTCDPTTGVIYASGGAGGSSENLYTIDPTTGEGTLVGPFGNGLGYAQALGCSDEGQLYMIDYSTEMLYNVDKLTGYAEMIGPTGTSTEIVDMAWDYQSQIMYAIGSGTFGYLFVVNLETGLCSPFEPLNGLLLDALSFKLDSGDDFPPTTTCTINGTNPVTITLTAEDDGGSGVNCTMYSIDGGPWMKYNGEPIIITKPGAHTIAFYSVDFAGNAETVKNVEFTVQPTLFIMISGGLGITFDITNEGSAPVAVNWTVEATGLVFPKHKAGTIESINPGDSVTRFMLVFGLGPTTFTVTANDVQQKATGVALIVLVLGVMNER